MAKYVDGNGLAKAMEIIDETYARQSALNDLVTSSELSEAITEAQLSGQVDLSDYLSTSDVTPLTALEINTIIDNVINSNE